MLFRSKRPPRAYLGFFIMQKFTFSENNDKIILHNLPPEMMIQVIFNDEDEYDVFEDVYELFEFRGNKIVVKRYSDTYKIDEMIDYQLVRNILRKAWKWYKSQVYIEKKMYEPGPLETDCYKLELQSGATDKWLATDKEHLITIFFEQGKFNETQRIIPIEDFTQEQVATLPRILSKMADWLAVNHADKV